MKPRLHKTMSITTGLLTIGALFLGSGFASAQAQGNPQEEIKELFKKVEKDLQEIDKLLQQATADSAAGAAAQPKSAASTAQKKQKGVSDDIQKIIELIPSSGGNCSSGQCNNHGLKKPGEGGQGQKQSQNQGGGQPRPQGSSAGQKPGEGSQGQQQQEKTAQGAGEAPTTQQSAKPDGGTPDGPEKSDATPEQKSGKPRDYATDRVNRGKEDAARWGDLPEHAQRAFSNENTADLPMRYRRWIQDFYLRMQKSSTTGGK